MSTDAEDPRVIAIVGFGYVGSSLAAILLERGFDVVGIDVDPTLVERVVAGEPAFSEPGVDEAFLAHGARLRMTGDHVAVATADTVVITVGTPVRPDGSLAGDQLAAACTAVSPYLGRGQLVVIKSTVPPGTTRRTIAPIIEASGLSVGSDVALAFTPERLAEGTSLRELRTLPCVVGGLTPACAEVAARFWADALGVEVLTQESVEAAEIVKLADNWWIDHNIALSNELAGFCDLFGVDVLRVIEAANTLPKGGGHVNILQPSVGVGGSCLTKDPWMVWRSASDQGFDIRTVPAARAANDEMPVRLASAALEELAALEKHPPHVTVAVLGLAFKNNTGDLRATPTRRFVDHLLEQGVSVRLHDPLVDAAEARELFGLDLVEDLREAVTDVDCIAVLARHDAFDAVDLTLLPTRPKCVLLDGRAHYPRETIDELEHAGYVYRGTGRR